MNLSQRSKDGMHDIESNGSKYGMTGTRNHINHSRHPLLTYRGSNTW